MNQDAFESQRRPKWDEFERILGSTKRIGSSFSADQINGFLTEYKAINRDLSLAQSRGYAQELVEHLNFLVGKGHRLLHVENKNWWSKFWVYIVSGFPQEIRSAKTYVLSATAVFVLPAVLLVTLIELIDPTYLYNVIPPASLEKIERMYDPANERFGRERGTHRDIEMFGFYIYNNISIALRTFAWGLVFGIGTVLILAFNGSYIGAITYYLTSIGYTSTFYTFVIAHGAFELTGLVFAGAAGLILGYSLLVPGRMSRGESVKRAAHRSIRIMIGVVAMLVIAAFIEAFWSSKSTVPDFVKYSVGGLAWLFVIWYFLFLGRRAA